MKRVALALAVVGLLGLILWASLAGTGAAALKVEVEPVSRREVVARVKVNGTVRPRRRVEIQSKVIGEIIELPVREGDQVRAGQVVLEIEKGIYLAARDQARAALDQSRVTLEQTKAELANAEVSLQRNERLHTEGVVSDDVLDQARLRRDSGRIAVRAQEEAIRQLTSAYRKALDDLDRTTLKAPIDGVVTAVHVEKGETAVTGTMNFAGSVLLEIGDLSELIAELEVAESEVVPVAVGQAADVELDALPALKMRGRVIEIGSSGVKQNDVVKFMVKVGLDAPDARVKPGMTARVEIVTAWRAGALAVPQQAVQTRWLDAGGHEVARREGDSGTREARVAYVVERGIAHLREVKTGLQDELWVEVVDGLGQGERVVTGPYRILRDLKNKDAVESATTRSPAAGSAGGENSSDH